MAPPSNRILYWQQTTDAQAFETGIQRVTRRLAAGLVRGGASVVPVGWDPVHRLMRTGSPDTSVDAREAAWLLLPEIPLDVLGEDLDPVQLAHAYGIRAAAIVHDVIPLRLSHLYGPDEAAVYRRYFRLFAEADLVLATTHVVAEHLRAYLAAENLRCPEIAVIPLPAQFGDRPRCFAPAPPRAATEPLRFIAVSTWEPRKNLAGMLRGVKIARERAPAPIHVTLVGRRGHHPEHDAEVMALLADLPGCDAAPWSDDGDLADLHASSHAGLYPSCDEGFGMPVLESLWLGRPCLCHDGSAMAEVAPGGGTLMVDMRDAKAIADVLTTLARQPDLLSTLSIEAVERPLRDWDDYAGDVASRLGPVGLVRGVQR